MVLAQILTALEVVKPIAKIVPVIGTSLEALIELIIEGCEVVEVYLDVIRNSGRTSHQPDL
jgi:ribonuclease PH